MITYYLPLTASHFSDTERDMLRFISEDRRSLIDRLRFNDSKMLSLYSALLARYSLNEVTGEPVSGFVFDRTEKGKPFVIGHEDIDINISHTKGMIICSVCDTGKVGVDVEHIRPVKYNIMKRCFHPDEIKYVNASADCDNPKNADFDHEHDFHFFEIWTKKEAFTKYLGTGLAIDITSINILSEEHNDRLFGFRSEDYVFAVYCDDIKKVSPVCISREELISAILSFGV